MMNEIKHKSMIEVLIYGEFMTYIRGTFAINILLKLVVWVYEKGLLIKERNNNYGKSK